MTEMTDIEFLERVHQVIEACKQEDPTVKVRCELPNSKYITIIREWPDGTYADLYTSRNFVTDSSPATTARAILGLSDNERYKAELLGQAPPLLTVAV